MSVKFDESAINEFVSSVGALVRKIRAESPAQHELSWSQVLVLSRIYRDGPVTIAELARVEGMKPQSMGTAVSALNVLGFVIRKPDPNDGRQSKIELTPKAVTLLKAGRAARRTWFAHAIEDLNRSEQATLMAAGEIMKRLAER